MPTACWIGIDVGATKSLRVRWTKPGSFCNERVVNTPVRDAASVEDTLFNLARELLEQHTSVSALGVSVAGWVDKDRRRVLFSSHMPFWRSEPLAGRLSDRLGSLVVLDNDANAAAWGEFKFGAGRGFSDVAVVTVGSGIGAGLVAEGRLLRGAHGFAGEFGHTVVDLNGPDCPCGRRGCVDSLASGRALERRFQALRVVGTGTLADTTASPDRGAPDIAGELIAAAANNGDQLAVQAFYDVGRWLGLGIADLVMYFDPDAVILAGGVASAGELLRRPTAEALGRCLASQEEFVKTLVLTGTLGPAAGAIGVAHLASLDRAGDPV